MEAQQDINEQIEEDSIRLLVDQCIGLLHTANTVTRTEASVRTLIIMNFTVGGLSTEPPRAPRASV